MRCNADQLLNQLAQTTPAVFLVYGDEQMLVEETADQIRQQLKQRGVTERQVWHVEGRFDWSQIRWREQSMSLFDNQRLIEIRLPSGAPGKDGGEIFRQFAAEPPEDTFLLIISGKIDNRSQKSKWFTALDGLGLTIPIWPVDVAQLPNWIRQRLKQKNMTIAPETAALMAERVEGNLFAAAQEIEKLTLLCPDGQVTEDIVLASVADNARFQAFGLMDTAISGQAAKIPRMVQQIRAEGTEILALFSAVSWSLHRLVTMAIQLEQGQQLDFIFRAQKPPVWDKAKPMMSKALQRHSALRWQQFLLQLADVDQAAKGQSQSCPWTLLETLCMNVAGIDHYLGEEKHIGYH